MAGEPIEALGGLTTMQAARKPYMDRLAALGRNGILHTVPEGFAPGSEIANLMIMGYDPAKVFEGRGSLEAAGMGIAIADDEMAMRCNLITIEEGRIKNHSAGHITSEESKELIEYLQDNLGGDRVDFFHGVSYRHLLKMHGGDKRLVCTPPHDVPGTPFRDVMIRPSVEDASAIEAANYLNDLTLQSQAYLADHPVNVRRREQGLDPANSIWLWSPGYRPKMEPLTTRFGLSSGAVITAVDLIKGIGIYAGLQPIEVEGATGRHDTNYEGKAAAAIEALRHSDFVFLHVEASDEAGHEGDYELKVKTIEMLDERIVRPIFEEVSTWDEPVSIAVLPDHPTPCHLRTHTSNPVPVIIYNPKVEGDTVDRFDEFAAAGGALGEMYGDEFIAEFLKQK